MTPGVFVSVSKPMSPVITADPDKPKTADKARPDTRRGDRPRDAQACEGARRYYQMMCRAPNSYQSRSMDCAEAYALYRQNCS